MPNLVHIIELLQLFLPLLAVTRALLTLCDSLPMSVKPLLVPGCPEPYVYAGSAPLSDL